MKYLGFYLKPNNYQKEDWIWLLKKVEKRLGNWCNGWISLGRGLTLVKSVLENNLVYWLSLTLIPRCILDKIRRRAFSFLRSGKREKEGMHMVSWDVLTRPKVYGGMGN